MALSSLSASFIQVGPNYSVNFPIDTESETPVQFEKISWNKFCLGADLRFNIGFLTLEEGVGTSFSEKLLLESFDISSLAGINFGFNTKVFGAGMMFGAGLRMRATKSGTKWLYNGLEKPSALAAVTSSVFFYKAALDLTFGELVTVSLGMTMPINQSVDTMSSVQDISVFEALSPSLKDTKLTLGVLFNLL